MQGLLSSHNLVPVSAMMTPDIKSCLPQYCHPCHNTNWPACQTGLPVKMYAWPACHYQYAAFPATTYAWLACHCLSRCMLGRPVIILPSCHVLYRSATMPACHNVCTANLLCRSATMPACHNSICLASLPQCWPATKYARPAYHCLR